MSARGRLKRRERRIMAVLCKGITGSWRLKFTPSPVSRFRAFPPRMAAATGQRRRADAPVTPLPGHARPCRRPGDAPAGSRVPAAAADKGRTGGAGKAGRSGVMRQTRSDKIQHWKPCGREKRRRCSAHPIADHPLRGRMNVDRVQRPSSPRKRAGVAAGPVRCPWGRIRNSPGCRPAPRCPDNRPNRPHYHIRRWCGSVRW